MEATGSMNSEVDSGSTSTGAFKSSILHNVSLESIGNENVSSLHAIIVKQSAEISTLRESEERLELAVTASISDKEHFVKENW